MLYFSIAELVRSAKAAALGIKNTPGKEYQKNLEALIDNVLDPARSAFGAPISVSSGFRCQELNAAVGGAGKSQHLKGEAADITVGDRKKNHNIGVIIARQGKFDQLIFEDCGRGDLLPQWIHVSYSRTANRGEIKKMVNGTYSRITLKELGIESGGSKGKTIDNVGGGAKFNPSGKSKNGINKDVL